MNFEFSAEQIQLKDIARKFLEKEDSVKRARAVLEGETSYDLQLLQYQRNMMDWGWAI
jgi:hypothetical protein